MQNIVVVFEKDNARIYHNPPNLEDYSKQSNALVNPDLHRVYGLPPHLWVKKGNEVHAAEGVLNTYEKQGVEERFIPKDFYHSNPKNYVSNQEAISLIFRALRKIPKASFYPLYVAFALHSSILLYLLFRLKGKL